MLSVFLRAALADILAPGRGCARCGGSPGPSLLPGWEQKAVEPTDVPGCRCRGHLPPRHTESGEHMRLTVGSWACVLWTEQGEVKCLHILTRTDNFVPSRTSWSATLSSPSFAAMPLTQKNTSPPSYCSSAKVQTRRSRTSIFSTARPWRWVTALVPPTAGPGWLFAPASGLTSDAASPRRQSRSVMLSHTQFRIPPRAEPRRSPTPSGRTNITTTRSKISETPPQYYMHRKHGRFIDMSLFWTCKTQQEEINKK